MGHAKYKVMSLFKTSITENCSKPRKPKIKKKQSEDKIIKTIEDRILRVLGGFWAKTRLLQTSKSKEFL